MSFYLKSKYMNRRSMLKGLLGSTVVSLALPPLEIMFDSKGAWADGGSELPFFGLFFWANGTPWHAGHGNVQAQGDHPDLWTPTQEGQNYTHSPLLSPLSNHQINVFTGLEPKTEIPPSPGGQGDGHMRGFMVALTGDRPESESFDHSSHTLTANRATLDQYIANHPNYYPTPPSYRSLEVGASTARFHRYGHWNAISYNGPNSLNLPILDPQLLHDRLFSINLDQNQNQERVRKQTLLLDHVLEDARRLETRLGASDRIRLNAHLEHLYEIQRRISSSAPECTIPPRPSGQGDLLSQTEQMADLIAIALQCNLTRVFSFMLTSPASTHLFSNLNVPDGMHKTCHDGHWDRVRSITEHHMQAFARFLDRFQAVDDPRGGNLLEHGLIYATSEYGEGWKHGNREHPILMAGQAGGRLQQNYHLRQSQGNLSRAQLTALHALGLNDASFGWNGGQTQDPFTQVLN
jgi:hypothetical protein